MKSTDAAWIAGFFEAEGSISISHPKRMVRVRVNTTDLDVMERLDALVPCPSGLRIRPPAQRHHQTQYEWILMRRADILEFVILVMPFLGERRLSKARDCLAFFDVPSPGVPFRPDDHESNIAWVAGLFEGEGCIHAPTSGRGVCLTLKMTDRDIVERLDALFPCPRIGTKLPSQPHHKTQYIWTITKGEEMKSILALISPHFGERRSARARELMAVLENRPGKLKRYGKTHCVHGHEYTPENSYVIPSGANKDARVCRTCRRDYLVIYNSRKRDPS